MQRLLHRATVKCGAGALKALENELARRLECWPDAVPLDAVAALRLSVREGCSNALRHGWNPGIEGQVTIALLHRDTGDHPGLCVEITDPGPGVKVDGAPPPYPDSLAGFEFVLRRVLDQRVIARVVSPWSIELRREEGNCEESAAGREELLQDLHGGGYGILMLCHCWSRVSFTLEPGTGNVLQLAGMRADPGG